jgi:hypothetical protein
MFDRLPGDCTTEDVQCGLDVLAQIRPAWSRSTATEAFRTRKSNGEWRNGLQVIAESEFRSTGVSPVSDAARHGRDAPCYWTVE